MFAVVDNDSESLGTLLLPDRLSHINKMTENVCLVGTGLAELRQSITVFGNDQHMDGCLRTDIPKRQAPVVFMDLIGRPLAAEDLIKDSGRSSTVRVT